MAADSLSEELARILRVAHQLGLVQLLGQASVRLENGDKIFITPGRSPGSPPPNRITGADTVTIDIEGRRLDGKFPAPRDVAMHLAIYRARKDVKAILHTQQPEMLAFGVVDRELLPLAHQSSSMAQKPLPRFGSGELINTSSQGEAMARALGDAPACQLPGQGLVVVGSEPAHALTIAHQLEELAKMNRLAASMGWLKTVAAPQALRIAAQRAGMEDFRDFYSSLDPGPGPQPPRKPSPDSIEGVKEIVATACHILQRFGLIRHLEHVSHRLPGGDRFIISPRGDLGRIRPDQLATVDMSGEWLDGPLAPPPFLFLHRDIFLARPDVQAIVHTHEIYGRLYPAGGISVPPLHRIGARIVNYDLPIYDIPDLIFDEEPRRAVLELLGQSPIVHERAHGTDFVASNIEEATAAAIHREWHLELHHRASQLGRLRSLPGSVVERLQEEEPSAGEWWDYWVGL